MADKVGRLEFDGQTIQLDRYKKLLEDYLPKGKDQFISFKIDNYMPYKALGIKTTDRGSKGGEIPIGAAQRQLACHDTVEDFPVWENNKWVKKSGLLRYYEGKKTDLKNDNAKVNNYDPTYITFFGGFMVFHAKNLAKIIYLLFHSENTRNTLRTEDDKEVGWSQKRPVFTVKLPSAKNKAVVKEVTEKAQAFSLINKLVLTDKPKLRMLHEACGFGDWDIHINADGEGDFDQITGPLLAIADKDPKTIIRHLKDTTLDTRAIVLRGINEGFVTREGNNYCWGTKVKDKVLAQKPPKERKIVTIPPGKYGPDVATDWFVGWVVKNPDVEGDIKTELDFAAKKKKEAADAT